MPRRHTVRLGECIASIAEMYGLPADAIWSLGDNAELKKLRQNPGTLAEGDKVVIPDKASKKVTITANKRHSFRRLGIPEKLRIQLVNQGVPRRKVPYELVIGKTKFEGTTDDKGWIEHPIPPSAMRGKLTVKRNQTERNFDTEEDEVEIYDVELGALAPVDTRDGAEARLRNLGFLPRADDVEDDGQGSGEAIDEATELGLLDGPEDKDLAFRRAVLEFQASQGLERTGELDDDTKKKLVLSHHT
jgi:hypothetical protein